MADKEVRLIDASKIEIFLHQMRYAAATHGMDYDAEIISIILETVEHEPTIEAQPVKHGRWMYGENDDGQDGIFCSECEHFVPWFYEYYDKSDDLINDNPRCPNCGSYNGMDGDSK